MRKPKLNSFYDIFDEGFGLTEKGVKEPTPNMEADRGFWYWSYDENNDVLYQIFIADNESSDIDEAVLKELT